MPRPLKSIKQTKQNTFKKLVSLQASELAGPTKTVQTVFVGLSGGVDSSVVAYLLKKQGYNVVGAFIKVWQPNFMECTWKEDRRSAMRVAAHLDIPFVTIDLSREYKREVVDYMIREYKVGRTPNPDVMCNKEIKFKAFLNKALKMGADMIATGHYARISYGHPTSSHSGRRMSDFQLLKAKDKAKEQSYFLWTLTQKELSRTLFPIGDLEKSEVRMIAKRAGLHTFERKDSQGLCFIGKVDFKDFLKRFIKEKKGNVLDTKGNIIGYHSGATFLTLGERHGLTITKKGTDDKPMYIVEKNIFKNTITVSNRKVNILDGRRKCLLQIESTNWINETPKKGKTYDAQVRYHQDYQKCRIKDNKIIFEKPQIAASGQSIVLYDKDACMGGGIIR